MQDRVEVPEVPVMLVDDSVQDRLVELVVTARLTVPPAGLLTVIIDVPAVPALTVTLVRLAVRLRPWPTW